MRGAGRSRTPWTAPRRSAGRSRRLGEPCSRNVRAADPSDGGVPQSRQEGCMGLLDGKNALVFGVANDHSIAWGIAKAFHDEGALVGFSSVESLIERRVRPLADSIGSPFVEPCDVTKDGEIRSVL